jgi:hypothetical protein
MEKYWRYISHSPPIVKTTMVVIAIGITLLAIHNIFFNLNRIDIAHWLVQNVNISLVLTTFNTTLLFNILAMFNKEKGENIVKHKETGRKINQVHHNTKSTGKKIEILTRKQFALEAKIEILEDLVIGKRQSKNNENT